MWCGSIEALVVSCRYGLVKTLGLYVNTLEYMELLNRIILIDVWKLDTLLSIMLVNRRQFSK